MNSKTTRNFRSMLATLPSNVRQDAREAYRQFDQNPAHPSLHLKKVHPTRPIYSVRISIDYRAIDELHGDDMVWFWIGPHGDYDKLLRRL